MLFRNNNLGIIRETPYTIWRRECRDHNNKKILYDFIEFKGIANPFQPLLMIFNSLLPTEKLLSQ